MKIAIVGPFFYPQLDGVEKVMLNHARHLVRRGHEVHIVCSRLRYPRGDFPDVPQRETMEGFTVHRLRVRVPHPGWRFFYLNNGGLVIDGLVRTLRRVQPDVVHAHQIAAAAWACGAAWYAWRAGKRFFYSPHYHPDIDLDRRFYNSLHFALNWLPVRVARKIMHLTAADLAPFAREYPAVPASRMMVLPNGVDPASARCLRSGSEAGVRFLFVGRVDEHRKGFDVLRSAFAHARRADWTLEVIGRVSDETRRGLEAEFGAAVQVRGLVDEAVLEQAYAQADVFVMPSRYEGFGMPYIEAMRYGVAVIGTQVGGIPEVVVSGTGLLVGVNDVPGLAAAMTRLAATPQERLQMGRRGRVWSEGFLWERVVSRLESAYIES